MTDDPTPTTATPTIAKRDEDLVIVPTLEGWLKLVQRVGELEASVPATVPLEPAAELVGGGELEQLARRLNRHRAELEEIKRWAAELLLALGPYLSNVPAAPSPAPVDRNYQ